jgi:chromosome segregation ATPase
MFYQVYNVFSFLFQAALAQMAASENIQSNLQAEIDVLSVRLAEAEADLVCARDDLTQSKSKQPLPNALDAITTQARMVVELQKDLSLLRAEFAIKNSECSELKQRLTLFSCPDQLLAEIEQLKASIAELKSEHESKLAAAIAEEKKTCAVACSELESKVASQQKEHQSQVSALTEQVQKLQQVEKDLRAQLAAEQQKSLEKSNLSKKNDAVKADEQAAAVQKAVTKATNQAAHTHRQQISKLERERADAERDLLKQIDSRKAELLEMGIQFEILKAEKDSHVCPRDLSQEVQRLQNQIRELHDASTKASEPVAKVLSAAQPASQSAAMSASGSTTIRERVREFGNQLCLHSFAILGVLFCVMMSILVSYMLRARSSYT